MALKGALDKALMRPKGLIGPLKGPYTVMTALITSLSALWPYKSKRAS
jgi:hypothetical protein